MGVGVSVGLGVGVGVGVGCISWNNFYAINFHFLSTPVDRSVN